MSFCILDANCSVYDSREKIPGMTYRALLCESCETECKRLINGLRYDYVDLSQIVSRNPQLAQVRIARSKPESSPPVDLHVWALREDIAFVLAAVSNEVRRELNVHPAPMREVREGWQVDHESRWLQSHVQDLVALSARSRVWLASQDEAQALDGVQVLSVFEAVHRSAQRAMGTLERVFSMPGFCPQCHFAALRRGEDPSKIWCARCQQRLTGDDYMRLIGLVHP